MNRQNAPVFRKSMNGFKKEDVTSYIINMSKRYSESEASFKYEIDRLNYEITTKNKAYDQLRLDFEKAIAVRENEIAAIKAENEKLKESFEEKEAELKSLQEKINSMPVSAKSEDPFESAIADNEKALLFDSISNKTGEIMLIACKTADDIIAKAQKEADEIINDANSRKNNMLRSISGSAETITSDINAYIKNAVSNCLDKIYSSIESVDNNVKK